MVRLKDQSDLLNNWLKTEISIPYGAIKRLICRHIADGAKLHFNSLWCD